MKYCEDCKWMVVEAIGLKYARCGHASAVDASNGDHMVTRAIAAPQRFASVMRMSRDGRHCGPDALHFEAKP